MNQVLQSLQNFASDRLPHLIVPIAILIVGWIVAVALGAAVRGALHRTNLDDRIARSMMGEVRAKGFDSARWTGKLVYYIVLLITVVAFLQALRLTAATVPIASLLEKVFAFLPKLLGAGVIAIVAWIVASLARKLMLTVLDRWDIDGRIARERGVIAAAKSEPPAKGERPEAEAKEAGAPVGRAIANTTYWIVLLLFVPAILDTLAIQGLLRPVQNMVDEVLGFLPNLASAALILAVGWFVARLIQRLVTNILVSIGTDRLSDRIGLTKALGKHSLSSLIGLVLYALILIPVAIGALNALQLEAITAPASDMLATFFGALPMLFAAFLVLAIAYVVARLLASLSEKLLRGIGFDDVLTKLGITRGEAVESGASARARGTTKAPSTEWSPSRVVGALVMVGVMLFALIEAADLLGFATVADLSGEIIELGGHILLGLVVFGFGMYFANLAAKAVMESGVSQPRVLSLLTRVAVLALAGAMALRQMGIADSIIELAFGLVLGSAAVAAALAFGLGGREAAGRAIENARVRMHESRRETTPPPAGARPDVAE